LLLPLVDNSSSGTSDNANGAEIVMILAEATVRVTIMVVQEVAVMTVPVAIKVVLEHIALLLENLILALMVLDILVLPYQIKTMFTKFV
jgi:hypothetical protein